MATVRDKWYTMPKGSDGKRHRVWHSSKDMLTLPQVVMGMETTPPVYDPGISDFLNNMVMQEESCNVK